MRRYVFRRPRDFGQRLKLSLVILSSVGVIRYWLGTTSADPTVDANWAFTDGGAGGASAPGTRDHAYFTGNGNNPCTLTANWLLGDLTTLVAYTAKLDLATLNLTMDNGGNITLDQGGEFDAGTGTISLTNGSFDNKDVATYTNGISTLRMAGTGTITTNISSDVYHLTIDAGAVITVFGTFDINGTATINGSISSSWYIRSRIPGVTTLLGAAGRITGTGTYAVQFPSLGEGITSFAEGGVIDIATLELFKWHPSAVLAPGTYQSAIVRIYNTTVATTTFTLSSGDYVFTGDVEFKNTGSGSLTIANNTNNPNIEIQGDLIFDEQAGTIIYNKGTGTLTLSGTTEYTDNTAAIQVLEDVDVDGTSLKLLTEMECDDFTLTSGAFDINGQTLDAGGNMDWASGSTITDPVGGTFGVAGNFTADGQDISGASGSWNLQVGGTAVASGTGDVAYCDASGYTEIDASVGPWADSGNNTNWDFGVVVGANTPWHLLVGAA